jgi:hypothetical protein
VRCRCYTVATSDPVVDLRPTCPGWSGWRDLNPRPLAPKASALPSCATPRAPASADRSLRDHQDTSSATAHIPPRSGQQVRLGPPRHRGASGRSSMAEPQPSKLAMRVRFPSPAPPTAARSDMTLKQPFQGPTAPRGSSTSSPPPQSRRAPPPHNQRHAPESGQSPGGE